MRFPTQKFPKHTDPRQTTNTEATRRHPLGRSDKQTAKQRACASAAVEERTLAVLAHWIRDTDQHIGQHGKIILPLPPNMSNRAGSSHWRTKAKAKERYIGQCAAFAALGLLPKPPETPPHKVLVTASLILFQGMDDDNAMARLKWCMDWLVKRGYMVDDKRKNCRFSMVPMQRVNRSEPVRVEITLTEVEEWPL